MYVPTLIFASDSLARPRSYRRSMLLLFFNYLEIIFDFAVIYSVGNFFNKPFHAWFDPIYFSFITSASIGYGDYYPVTGFGKLIVSCHSVVFLIFVVVFLNFFSSKMESTGYFDDTKQS
jgi:Fe2+ transport system protein B